MDSVDDNVETVSILTVAPVSIWDSDGEDLDEEILKIHDPYLMRCDI